MGIQSALERVQEQRGTMGTSDGGVTWEAQASGTLQGLVGVGFVNGRLGWAVGHGGAIAHTSDGGVTWEAQASGTAEGLAGVAFADGDHGWAVGARGTILHTADGGATWKAQASRTD